MNYIHQYLYTYGGIDGFINLQSLKGDTKIEMTSENISPKGVPKGLKGQEIIVGARKINGTLKINGTIKFKIKWSVVFFNIPV